MAGCSLQSLIKGNHSLGAVESHQVMIMDKLMDSKSLFLTGNTSTMYVVPGLDLHACFHRQRTGCGRQEFASIGIEKGKPFNPDKRMKAILTDAIAIANAAARSIVWYPRTEGNMKGVRIYPDMGPTNYTYRRTRRPRTSGR